MGFCDSFINDTEKAEEPKVNNKSNLTKEEKEALKDLQSHDDIIITNADKGGAVVIQDVTDYIKEANRQLNNTTFYKQVQNDLTERHENLIKHTLEDLRDENLLTEKTCNHLKPKNSKTPKFYMNPKIHKKGNPGRPVISSVNCHTSYISEFVDQHLQPHVKQLKSYVQDTTDFINKTKNIHIPNNSILVTMDVSSLYTNIPNDEGIDAVTET